MQHMRDDREDLPRIRRTLEFDGQRCINVRFCVTGAPDVLKASSPGEWIFPDETDSETLVGVARACPSGAIRYYRKDGGGEERPRQSTCSTCAKIVAARSAAHS